MSLNESPIASITSSSASLVFRVHIHSSSLQTVNIQLNIHSLDFSSFAGKELDLGGDDCEEAESESYAQLMSNTSDSDIDSGCVCNGCVCNG